MRRLRPESSGRSILLLSSVLALLALACFPVLSQASVGAQYEVATPGPGNKNADPNEPIAKTQADPKSGGAEAPADPGYEETSEESSEGSSESEGGAAAKGQDGGTGQGSPDKGSNREAPAKVQAPAPSKIVTTESDDGGSSPLVPILIGILVLAAISVAAVMIRQRRRGDAGGEPSLSTKAG